MTGSRLFRPLKALAAGLLLLAFIVGVFSLVSRSVRVLSVDSGSMEPVLSRGDAVIVGRVAPLDIRAGDIVSYRDPQDGLIITHRVVAADPLTGQIITKGDANGEADQPFNGIAVVGRQVAVMPGLGRYIDMLHSWPGLIVAVYAPTMLVLASEARRFWKHYVHPTYVHHIWRYNGWY
jgi:signal peptidase I